MTLLMKYMRPTHQKVATTWVLPPPLPPSRRPHHQLPLLLQSDTVHLLPLSCLFLIRTAHSPLPRIIHHLTPRSPLQIMMPYSTSPTLIFQEILHLPPNSLPLVQTSQMPSLALLLRLHNWLSLSARLFLRYAMPP